MEKILFLAQSIRVDGLPTTPADADSLRNVFTTGLAVAGGLSVLFLIIGAARYALSAGDSGQTKQARDTIIYSLIGLVISASAFFIVQFVLGSVTNP